MVDSNLCQTSPLVKRPNPLSPLGLLKKDKRTKEHNSPRAATIAGMVLARVELFTLSLVSTSLNAIN